MSVTNIPNATAVLTPPAPVKGQPMTITITGGITQRTTSTVGPLTGKVQAAGGTSFDIAIPTATMTSDVQVPVKLVSVSDPAGRSWTIAADGQSAMATA